MYLIVKIIDFLFNFEWISLLIQGLHTLLAILCHQNELKTKRFRFGTLHPFSVA